jgi:UDP-N-acetylmuramoyl-tripeptide--D-alanyl-D-alanine ligase
MDIHTLYQLYLKDRLVSTDSRNITPGCIFFALKGDNFNGNQFALQAIDKGASAAFVDEDQVKPHPRIFKVQNVLSVLQKLAAHHRKQSGFIILAITGSNGKTTTKELCRTVLSKKYSVYATGGNLNNHIGVPLTLLAMGPSVQVGIVEMGANHPGEIRDLCLIAQPDYGLITNVGKAHLEGFGSIEGVARAKGELFQHLMANRQTIFLNIGDQYMQKLVPDDYPHVVRYNGDKGLRVKSRSSDPLLRLAVTDGVIVAELKTNLLGSYNSENVLAACCVGIHLGVPLPLIREAIFEYRPQNHRSQLLDSGRNRLFMDAYNANPSSMRAAIDEFLLLNDHNKMMILGEMREMGDSAQEEHEALIRYLKDRKIQRVMCVGRSFELILSGTGYLYFATVEELLTHLTAHPVKDHFILVKGSRANKLEKVLPLL